MAGKRWELVAVLAVVAVCNFMPTVLRSLIVDRKKDEPEVVGALEEIHALTKLH